MARTPPGYWYVRRVAPKLDAPLLTTTGAKTGLAREHPLLYVADSVGLILIASNYGRPGHPAWYRNLIANPRVEVVAGRHSGTYTAAEILDPAQRSEAWDKALDMYAGYSDYELRAGNRTIPLIRLVRGQ